MKIFSSRAVLLLETKRFNKIKARAKKRRHTEAQNRRSVASFRSLKTLGYIYCVPSPAVAWKRENFAPSMLRSRVVELMSHAAIEGAAEISQ